MIHGIYTKIFVYFFGYSKQVFPEFKKIPLEVGAVIECSNVVLKFYFINLYTTVNFYSPFWFFIPLIDNNKKKSKKKFF